MVNQKDIDEIRKRILTLMGMETGGQQEEIDNKFETDSVGLSSSVNMDSSDPAGDVNPKFKTENEFSKRNEDISMVKIDEINQKIGEMMKFSNQKDLREKPPWAEQIAARITTLMGTKNTELEGWTTKLEQVIDGVDIDSVETDLGKFESRSREIEAEVSNSENEELSVKIDMIIQAQTQITEKLKTMEKYIVGKSKTAPVDSGFVTNFFQQSLNPPVDEGNPQPKIPVVDGINFVNEVQIYHGNSKFRDYQEGVVLPCYNFVRILYDRGREFRRPNSVDKYLEDFISELKCENGNFLYLLIVNCNWFLCGSNGASYSRMLFDRGRIGETLLWSSHSKGFNTSCLITIQDLLNHTCVDDFVRVQLATSDNEGCAVILFETNPQRILIGLKLFTTQLTKLTAIEDVQELEYNFLNGDVFKWGFIVISDLPSSTVSGSIRWNVNWNEVCSQLLQFKHAMNVKSGVRRAHHQHGYCCEASKRRFKCGQHPLFMFALPKRCYKNVEIKVILIHVHVNAGEVFGVGCWVTKCVELMEHCTESQGKVIMFTPGSCTAEGSGSMTWCTSVLLQQHGYKMVIRRAQNSVLLHMKTVSDSMKRWPSLQNLHQTIDFQGFVDGCEMFDRSQEFQQKESVESGLSYVCVCFEAPRHWSCGNNRWSLSWGVNHLLLHLTNRLYERRKAGNEQSLYYGCEKFKPEFTCGQQHPFMMFLHKAYEMKILDNVVWGFCRNGRLLPWQLPKELSTDIELLHVTSRKMDVRVQLNEQAYILVTQPEMFMCNSVPYSFDVGYLLPLHYKNCRSLSYYNHKTEMTVGSVGHLRLLVGGVVLLCIGWENLKDYCTSSTCRVLKSFILEDKDVLVECAVQLWVIHWVKAGSMSLGKRSTSHQYITVSQMTEMKLCISYNGLMGNLLMGVLYHYYKEEYVKLTMELSVLISKKILGYSTRIQCGGFLEWVVATTLRVQECMMVSQYYSLLVSHSAAVGTANSGRASYCNLATLVFNVLMLEGLTEDYLEFRKMKDINLVQVIFQCLKAISFNDSNEEVIFSKEIGKESLPGRKWWYAGVYFLYSKVLIQSVPILFLGFILMMELGLILILRVMVILGLRMELEDGYGLYSPQEEYQWLRLSVLQLRSHISLLTVYIARSYSCSVSVS